MPNKSGTTENELASPKKEKQPIERDNRVTTSTWLRRFQRSIQRERFLLAEKQLKSLRIQQQQQKKVYTVEFIDDMLTDVWRQ